MGTVMPHDAHYVAFVLPAYGLSALGLLWMILDSALRARRWKRAVDALEDSRS